MNKSKKLLLFLIAIGAIIFLIYQFRIGGESYPKIAQAIVYVIPLIPVFFGYDAFRFFGLKSTQGKSVLLIALAIACFLLGDVIWPFTGLAVVSVADIFWFLGYFLLYSGMIYAMRILQSHILHDKKKLAIIVLGCIAVVFLYFNFVPLSWDKEIGTLENITTAGYILADLVLAILSTIILGIVFYGSYSTFWILFTVGSLFRLVGDILYTLNYDLFQTGSMMELPWLFSYIFYAASFIMLKAQTQKLVDSIAGSKKE